jgi:hypothetical protein
VASESIPPGAADRERLPGELVHDVQQLQDVPVGGLVELEVKRPHVVGALGSQTARRDRGVPEPLALAAALGTRSPSSRQMRCTRLRLICQPSPRSSA